MVLSVFTSMSQKKKKKKKERERKREGKKGRNEGIESPPDINNGLLKGWYERSGQRWNSLSHMVFLNFTFMTVSVNQKGSWALEISRSPDSRSFLCLFRFDSVLPFC